MITNELISLFSFLLPGFITSFLFYSLTSFPKKSEFEAVVIALVYTIVIKAIVELLEILFIFLGKHLTAIGEWTELSTTVSSIIIALVIGLVWSRLYNNDILHKWLRKWKITNQTSYPSEWYGTFTETKKYVILDLKDERRIMGWPAEWPNSPQQGHFVLEEAKWLVDKNGEADIISLETIDKILIDTKNVEMVEFVKSEEELSDFVPKPEQAVGQTEKNPVFLLKLKKLFQRLMFWKNFKE
jgi:hypothetical protein